MGNDGRDAIGKPQGLAPQAVPALGLAGWLEIIKGVLEFPGEIRRLIAMLRKTPQQKHEELIGRIQKEVEAAAAGERPSWDD